MTQKFAGHSRLLGPECGTWFMSPFWRLEFGGVSHIFFGKFVVL